MKTAVIASLIPLSLLCTLQAAATESLCAAPFSEQQIVEVFAKNAANQIRLEFGDQYLQVTHVEQRSAAVDLVRVEADVQYRRPGVKGPSKMHIVGWVSRCAGTTIVRGNTWLAEGTLSVTRYADADLPGKGVFLGDPAAPVHVIAFIDSRCPNCHRLISYATELAQKGAIYIELRQVAYLEDIHEALADTRLFETALALGEGAALTNDKYLELVGGLVSEAPVDRKVKGYATAKSLLEENTRVAREVLHLQAVPGVLIKESQTLVSPQPGSAQQNLRQHGAQTKAQYRLMGHWEMNRLMQPDL